MTCATHTHTRNRRSRCGRICAGARCVPMSLSSSSDARCAAAQDASCGCAALLSQDGSRASSVAVAHAVMSEPPPLPHWGGRASGRGGPGRGYARHRRGSLYRPRGDPGRAVTATMFEAPVDRPATFGRVRPPLLVIVNGHTYRTAAGVDDGRVRAPQQGPTARWPACRPARRSRSCWRWTPDRAPLMCQPSSPRLAPDTIAPEPCANRARDRRAGSSHGLRQTGATLAAPVPMSFAARERLPATLPS